MLNMSKRQLQEMRRKGTLREQLGARISAGNLPNAAPLSNPLLPKPGNVAMRLFGKLRKK